MASEKGPDLPKYQRIADNLKAAIDAGEYGPGDRLPGENALAAQYGVASLTARQALKTLKNQGLAESRKGAGVFVQAFRPIRRHGIQRLARDQWGAGKSIWEADEDRSLDVDRVMVERADPPAHIAQVLDLTADHTVCMRSRRYVLEGRPVMSAVSYLPYDLVEGSPITQADTGPGGIYARLADLGHAVTRFREEIRSRLPTAAEAKILGMPAERPVLKLCRTAFDGDGRVVEVNEMTLDSTSYVLDYEFDA
ncbi:GntR family transcriptional regulator (plasmid) [Streptomyces poriferorum]|uniref:GntR family transcriptional regulator n=1 Tax=Streptomyces poriferorum TaxID=2798799 RepID=UPI00273DFD4E|nr:GntR family transcriptional regulator [Streptomyces sp. Alt1]WLQ53784.1 GntR family transcriptional regulator [Streptomyces sp. Alt1]